MGTHVDHIGREIRAGFLRLPVTMEERMPTVEQTGNGARAWREKKNVADPVPA